MNFQINRRLSIFLFGVVLSLWAVNAQAKLTVDGVIVDSARQLPVPQATLRVISTATSTLANDDGHFRLVLDNGSHYIKATHVAFYSDSVQVSGTDTVVTMRFVLRPAPIELGNTTVRPRMYDPAQEIIRQAIKRKKDILSRIHDYTCQAYSRVNVHDNTKVDSALFLITETKTSCYWQQPDKYKEIITARRQSANLKADDNLFSIGQVLNFNRNRIELGRYSIASPTATDALDHYRYYLLDTILVDNRPVFVLELEPKSKVTPLFAGTIQIADSSFDVVSVDVGFNDAVDFGILVNPRYIQRLAPLTADIWMPVEIRFSGDVKFKFPFPGIPNDMSFLQLASLSDYVFDNGLPDETFDEYVMEVAPTADQGDSSIWLAEHVIPLSHEESVAYRTIDSIEHAPKPFLKQAAKVVPIALLITTFGADDFFRFNRVEGPYLGGASSPKVGHFSFPVAGGYAFSAERWQGSLGVVYRSEKQSVSLGVRGFDQMVRRSALITTPEISSTFEALWIKFDGVDYFRERGGTLWAETKPLGHLRIRGGLKATRQTTESIHTKFSVFRNELTPRENPAINDGDMHLTFATVSYDSRKKIKTRKGEQFDFSPTLLKVQLRGEWSSPDFLNSDFQFDRYEATIEARFRPPIPGIAALRFAGGITDGTPPVQSWLVVDHGTGGLFDRRGFATLNERNFVGSSAASITLEHNFGKHAFALTHLPLIEKIPFSVSVRGAAFWTGDSRIPATALPDIQVAKKAYTEAGFSVGNLTPFLSPFNLRVWANWQLSAYDTNKSAVGFDFAF